jgi:hypothetical protein
MDGGRLRAGMPALLQPVQRQLHYRAPPEGCSMSIKRMFIVGDRFKRFAQNDQVVSASSAEQLLQAHDPLLDHNVRLMLGQGVSLPRIQRLLDLAEHQNRSYLMDFGCPDKAGRQHAHKHQAYNSMISMPRRIGPSTFTLDVLLDDDCAELSDHMTGQHIQGMALLEATRQAFLAVTEEFYLKDEAESSYFVINQMDTEYRQFVFPLPISILYEVQEHTCRNHSHKFKVMMSVIQAQQICCVVTTRFSTYYDSFITSKENALAKQILEHELHPEWTREKRA